MRNNQMVTAAFAANGNVMSANKPQFLVVPVGIITTDIGDI